jgi:radical SAM protein with 4Fe4S-binding SPASM domain
MKLKHKLQSKAQNYYKKMEIKDHNLLYLFLEITRKCNLNCLHCGSDCKSESELAELTTISWLKIIDYIADKYSDELTFVITGGEPLVHKDLIKIVSHIKKRKRRWGMVSNGLILTENKFKELLDAGLYSITLSLDGLEKAHNKLRNNPNSFKTVLNALEFIGRSNLKFKDVVTCVYPENLNELDQIAEILIDKGITSWRLFRIFPSGRAYNNPVTQLSYEQTWQKINWIKEHRKKYAKRGLHISMSCEGFIPFDIDRQVRDEPFFCRAGINIASVLADGNITGCSNNDESFYVGNILKDDFSYVWEHNFDIFRKKEWLCNTVCNNCEYLNSCMGSSVHLWQVGEQKPKFCYVKKDL